jgi:hypothetical protein
MGALIGSVQAPFQARGQRLFTLSITDNTNPALALSAQSLVTALDVRVTPGNARPSRRVRFRGRGFTGDAPAVYAHYVRKGKLRKTVSLGTPQAPCGRVSVKRRQIPIKRPAVGRWTLQVDNQPFYSAEPLSVFVRLAIAVRRVPRPSS